jgi:hypothetical protein
MILEKNNHYNVIQLSNEELKVLKNIVDDALNVYGEYLVDNEESDLAYDLSCKL